MAKSESTKKEEQSTSSDSTFTTFLLVVYCLGYAVSSSNQSIITKRLYNEFPQFQSPITQMCFQFLFNITVLGSMSLFKQCKKDSFKWLSDIKFDVTPMGQLFTLKLKPGLACGTANLSQLLFGMQALYLVSIPMYLVQRRCAILATIIAAYLTKGDIPQRESVITCFLYITGSFIAGYEQLDTDGFGFAICWLCNFLGMFSHILIQHFNKEKLVNAFDTCFFFSFVGFCTIAPYVVYSQNHLVVYDILTKQEGNWQTFAWIFGTSSMSGLVITIFTMLVVAIGGPFAMNITGNLRDVALTYISFLMFNDTKTTPMIMIGLSISFLGSGIFCYAKIKEEFGKKPEQKTEVAETQEKAAEDQKKKRKRSPSPTGKKSPKRSGKSSPSRKSGSPTRRRAKVE